MTNITPLNSVVAAVTDNIRRRSQPWRDEYLQHMARAVTDRPQRQSLSCGNLAHGFAACGSSDKQVLKLGERPNIGIVTAYNDMLSAHMPFKDYPDLIKQAARHLGATAQVAGGVPAMCDGVTQGQAGMELSLFSRDNIAQATAVALSHNMFDAALCLGVCDKIVPGLLIGALRFAHMPVIFVPAGPMPSGLPNAEKARVRQLYAEGKAGREELLEAESQSYHSPGTCTFYGTANSNQMLMEFMGLHIAGSAFVNPDDPLRASLTAAAAEYAVRFCAPGETFNPLYRVFDERSLVNGLVGLLATGGSTNLTIHLIAIARAAGLVLNWDDFDQLSRVVPLLARVYPNGMADVNHFHAAGGLALVMRELMAGGLLHAEANTVMGENLRAYTREPYHVLEGDCASATLAWREGAEASLDPQIISSLSDPFAAQGGISLLQGNLGRSIIKVSAVKPEHRKITAPAKVFDSQQQVLQAFKAGMLEQDCVVVLRGQGPKANGMPELHKLTPTLGVLQDRGYQVALVTDGRMSGASGKVPAAIHLWPEALEQGPIARLRDGDCICLDAEAGRLEVLVEAEDWCAREPAAVDFAANQVGCGRELFSLFRNQVGMAESGATVLFESIDAE